MKILTGWNVYRSADGCAPSYYGFAGSIDEAERLARSGGSLEQCLWETARRAGHCAGIAAPDHEGEDPEGARWIGEDGYDCAVPVYKDVAESVATE